jgi:micrococcal nuclease
MNPKPSTIGWPRLATIVIVVLVTLTGTSAFATGGSSATQIEASAEWSPNPAKEVTPDNDTETDETDTTPICPDNTTTADSIAITEVQAIAPDGETDDLNGEFIVLTNIGDTSVDLSGYTLDYDDGEEISFNEFTLAMGESVTIYSGSGQNTQTDLYVGAEQGLLNNDDPDTITLNDESGNVVDRVTGYDTPEDIEDNCGDIDDAPMTNATAEIVFNDQESNGMGVVVESVTIPDGGFVVIHDRSNLSQGEIEESVIGATYLEPGATATLPVGLFDLADDDLPDKEFDRTRLTEDQTLVAVVYRDTDDDQQYDFLSTDGDDDDPYVADDGSAIGDFAAIGPDPVGDDAYVEINNSTASEDRTATVTRVIDGDTVEVEFENGEIDTVRLLGVDTPETALGNVDPPEYEGIPNTTAGRDHLYNWGQQASEYATEELEGETVRVATDPESDRRGSFDRLLAYIYVDGENFNLELIEQGYARMYDSTFGQQSEFDDAEGEARSENEGLWDFDGSDSGGSSEFPLPFGRAAIPTVVLTLTALVATRADSMR